MGRRGKKGKDPLASTSHLSSLSAGWRKGGKERNMQRVDEMEGEKKGRKVEREADYLFLPLFSANYSGGGRKGGPREKNKGPKPRAVSMYYCDHATLWRGSMREEKRRGETAKKKCDLLRRWRTGGGRGKKKEGKKGKSPIFLGKGGWKLEGLDNQNLPSALNKGEKNRKHHYTRGGKGKGGEKKKREKKKEGLTGIFHPRLHHRNQHF